MTFDNDIKIMVDPSWNGENPDDILFLEQYLRITNFILLSHATPDFIGGYVLMCVKFPSLLSNIPVYSTVPVNQLGRISTVEFYRSCGILGPLKGALIEIEEVDEWFDKIIPLKYFQSLSLFDNNLNLTPYNAGHTLGGTFWLITKKLEKVIYAPSWNHSKDSFLNSASFLSNGNPLSLLMRPTALITNTDLGSTMSHKKRTEKFLSLVDATLANGGAVLLPTSLSGRFLELLHLIDQHLQSAPIPVYFLSYSGTKVLSYASTLLEWMSSLMVKEWEEASSSATLSNKNNFPYDPSKVDLLLDPEELIQLSGPKIVFSSGVDFRNGDMSSAALAYLCQDQNTTIILTEKSHFSSNEFISSRLYHEWYKLTKIKNGTVEDGIAVPLETVVKLDGWTREEPLVGTELSDFKEGIEQTRKQKLIAKVKNRKNQDLLNADTISGDETSDDEESDNENPDNLDDLKLKSASTAVASVDEINDALIVDNVRDALDSNQPLDIKITYKMKPRQAMFPYFSALHKQKFDDYGEVIDLASFQKNEDSTTNKLIMDSKKKFDDKRKWGNVDKNGKKNDKNNKNNQGSKLTPQEVLNNQVLQKNLDTLFSPRKRVPLNGASSLSTQPQELRIRCGLSFVDLSGLVDSRSLSIIVSALKPYNLLLLPDFTNSEGDNDTADGLKQVKKMFDQQQDQHEAIQQDTTLLSSSKVMSLASIRRGMMSASGYNESKKMIVTGIEYNLAVNIGGEDNPSGLNNFEVKLDDNVINSLKWQKLDGSHRIAKVYGQLEIHNPESSVRKKQRTVNDFINPSTKFLLTQPSSEYSQEKSTPKLAVGNIRLPELKRKLLSRDLSAEFKSEGTLVVNDVLAIRKVSYSGIEGDDTGDIVIDGIMGPLYYEVRACIREMLAYV